MPTITPESVLSGSLISTKNISKYAKGALLLFAIATLIAGWAGNTLFTIIVVVVMVFFFMIALLGFERMSKARSGFYSKLAMVMTAFTLVCILSLGATMLFYIGFGKPVWLDRVFGYSPAPAPEASISPGSIGETSVVILVRPYQLEGAKIEIQIFAELSPDVDRVFFYPRENFSLI